MRHLVEKSSRNTNLKWRPLLIYLIMRYVKLQLGEAMLVAVEGMKIDYSHIPIDLTTARHQGSVTLFLGCQKPQEYFQGRQIYIQLVATLID